ncbi:putative RNA uridine N3 methyltransferase [Methermicoccus shengliensis]|nr:putative RNA uridine N3 methyltransferase [Methermicoccus shengliensis]
MVGQSQERDMKVAGGNLAILIPSSFGSEERDERIRTYKIGQVARAASVFRVDDIYIYRDEDRDDSRLIDLVLRYAETPQYLRKLLFPKRRELKYAGVVPPLRTPHHPTTSDTSKTNIGDIRTGVVTKVGSDGSAWVELGLESPAPLRNPKGVKVGQRIDVRIFSKTPLTVEYIAREHIPTYWGYRTHVCGPLHSTLSALRSRGWWVLGTSREGRPLDANALIALKGHMSGRVCVVFGSQKRGIREMLSAHVGDGWRQHFDEVLNTIPNQGTHTVRAEEALMATLALLNIVRS